MDSFLLMALAGWVLYWMTVYVVQTGGLALPSTLRNPAIGWGVLAVPIAIGLLRRLTMWVQESRSYQRGDHVVYKMPKTSTHPAPRAEDVYPFPHGEEYSYFVRKPWTVVSVSHDNRVVEVLTPGGKRRIVRADDRLLHKAHLLEELKLRLRWHKSFPEVATAA